MKSWRLHRVWMKAPWTGSRGAIAGLADAGFGAMQLFCPSGVLRVRSLQLTNEEVPVGRGILLWLLGVPIPIIILLALFWH
jgi:hypothetical protein